MGPIKMLAGIFWSLIKYVLKFILYVIMLVLAWIWETLKPYAYNLAKDLAMQALEILFRYCWPILVLVVIFLIFCIIF